MNVQDVATEIKKEKVLIHNELTVINSFNVSFTVTYGPFSTLMERILLKPLSMMFWHSSMNSQRFPWKFSSSQTVILNWPICSIC